MDFLAKCLEFPRDIVQRRFHPLMLLEETANDFNRHVRLADSVELAVLGISRVTANHFLDVTLPKVREAVRRDFQLDGFPVPADRERCLASGHEPFDGRFGRIP